MGDRTYTAYRVNEKTGETFLDELMEYCTGEDWNEGDAPGVYSFYDANYGKVDEIEELLDSIGITYFHEWQSGGDYNAGSVYSDKDRESDNLTEQGILTIDARSMLKAFDSRDTDYIDGVRKELAFITKCEGDIADTLYSQEDALLYLISHSKDADSISATEWLIDNVDLRSLLTENSEGGANPFAQKLLTALLQEKGLFSKISDPDDAELIEPLGKMIAILTDNSVNLSPEQGEQLMGIYTPSLRTVKKSPALTI